MKTAVDQIQNLIILTSHENEKYKNHLSAVYGQKFILILKKVESLIQSNYSQSNTTIKANKELQKKIDNLLASEMSKLEANLFSELSDFTWASTKLTTDQLRGVFEPVKKFVNISQIKKSKVLNGFKNGYLTFNQGETHTIVSLFALFLAKLKVSIKQATSQAYILDKSVEDYTDSIFGPIGSSGMSQNHLDTLIATLVTYGYASALNRTFTENKDILSGYEWLSVMDSATSDICLDLDRRYWVYGHPEKSTLPYEITPPAHHNCYDKDTEVYTDVGWRFFKDLEGSEKCLSFNPEDIKENGFIQPMNYIQYHHTGEMIKYESKTFSMCVTPDHNMVIKYNKKDGAGKYRFVKAKDTPKWNNSFYRGLEWDGDSSIDSIKLGDYQIPTDLYCTFMGYYLSEGSSTKIKGSRSYRVKIAQEKYHDKMFYDLNNLPFNVTSTGRQAINIYDYSVGKELKMYGKSFEKYVPSIIKTLPPERIQLFLDAYTLGDGSVNESTGYKEENFKPFKTIFTSSKQMADDLGELILKAGGRPSYRLDPTKGDEVTFKNGTYTINHDMWAVGWCSHTEATTERTSKTIIPYDGMVYCVELPKWHTLFVRHNGKVAWSGNCRSSIAPIVYTYAELGIPMDSLAPQQQELLSGGLDKPLTYSEFIHGQPPSLQREILGPVRYSMFKSGEITADKFFTRDGRRLSLYELQKRGYSVSSEYLRYVRK